MRILLYSCCVLFLSSCVQNNLEPDDETTDGKAYVPVYFKSQYTGAVTTQGARATIRAGKIYAYGNYIFQNELNEGIHIIDNSNTSQPKKIAFLSIPYNTDLAVQGNYIYANHVSDLLVIDIHDPSHPALVKTLKDAFPLINQQYPPQQGRFVCPDTSKGIVIDWELKDVKTANCRK